MIVVFIMLWGLNIWALDRSPIRSKYLSVLSVKSGQYHHLLFLLILFSDSNEYFDAYFSKNACFLHVKYFSVKNLMMD